MCSDELHRGPFSHMTPPCARTKGVDVSSSCFQKSNHHLSHATTFERYYFFRLSTAFTEQTSRLMKQESF